MGRWAALVVSVGRVALVALPGCREWADPAMVALATVEGAPAQAVGPAAAVALGLVVTEPGWGMVAVVVQGVVQEAAVLEALAAGHLLEAPHTSTPECSLR